MKTFRLDHVRIQNVTEQGITGGDERIFRDQLHKLVEDLPFPALEKLFTLSKQIPQEQEEPAGRIPVKYKICVTIDI